MTLMLAATPAQLRGQQDIARRKKVQSKISTGSAALGAAGLGVLGASVLARKKPHLLRIKPGNADKVASDLATKGVYTSVGSTGVGSASSLYFAGTQRKEAQMDNMALRRQRLASIKKRASQAVPADSSAWKRAGRDSDERWREYASPGAQRAYDYALAPSRAKRDTRRSQAGWAAGAGAVGGVGSLTAAAASRRPRNKLTALGAAAAAGAGGFYGNRELNRRADKYDLPSRKIRARGMQRLEDAVAAGYADDLVHKGVSRFGGAVASKVVRLPNGGMAMRRGYLVPRRWNK